MNRGEMRTEVRRATGLAADDPQALDADVNAEINNALAMIASEASWWWQRSYSALVLGQGVFTLAVPANALRVHTISSDQVGTLRELTPGEFFDRYPNGDTDGETLFWSVTANTIYFAPTPVRTTQLGLQVTIPEPVLSVDGSTPLMPATFHTAIVDLAAHRIMRRRADSRADDFLTSYKDQLRRMRDDQNRSAGGRVRVRRGGWL